MRAIDADALEKAISVSHSMTDDCGIKTGYEISMMLIEDAPTIEPERKKGKWIDGKCDQCGCHAPYWSMATTYYNSNYCPECGADMRGEQE